MNAGELRHRIAIQALGSETQDSVGQPSQGWANVVTNFPAKVEPLNGREYFGGQQLLSEVTTRITVRYRSGITNRNRVVYAGENYDILDVIPVGKMLNEGLQLMCRVGLVDVVS